MKDKKFYVGDLCYVLDSDTCDELFGLVADSLLLEGESVTLQDGRKFFLGRTSHGDGNYFGSDGNNYSVDSGTIGIVAVEDISNENKFNHEYQGTLYWEQLGHVHKMPSDSLEKSTSEFGYFKLGTIEISAN